MKRAIANSRTSLTRRLLWVLICSLTVVAILLGASGAWIIEGVAEQTGDRVLKASARAIAETLAVEDGEITLDLPPAALGMLEDDARDNIYYNIRHQGRLLTGYPDFPADPSPQGDVEGTRFRYATYRGVPVRVATEIRSLPRIHGSVVVQVAETLNERNALSHRLLSGLAILEGAFIIVAGLLVWPAVSWGLRPVTRLRRELDERRAATADFTPLPTDAVPNELRGLVVAFNALLGRLEQAVTGMRRFTADASHQMRTPLAILRTHLALVREHGSHTPEGQSSLLDVEAAINRLQRLLTQLIALARAEETNVATIQIDRFDLCEVAAEAARLIAPRAVDQDVEIRFEAEARTVIVQSNSVLVQEVITNLLENAIRYSGAGGVATVRVKGHRDGALLEVEDDGPGIPPSEHERVFQRFHRLSRDQHHPGSGLGLPIVKALAQAMGADLALSSGQGQVGLKVSLVLPNAKPLPG